MKKSFFNLIAFTLVFAMAGKAQQVEMKAEAVLRPDGSREIRITDAAGKVTTVTAGDEASLQAKYLAVVQQKPGVTVTPSAIDNKTAIVSHRAVMGKDGNQQIILTDASGKEITITAAKGESVQENYQAYLKKAGIACGCSPVVNTPVAEQKTAVRNAGLNTDASNEPDHIVSLEVSLEGGAIKKGDLLVNSSKAGIAMKADLSTIKSGQVIGKALQDFNSATPGKINVSMVLIK